jgi:hypothetical protein
MKIKVMHIGKKFRIMILEDLFACDVLHQTIGSDFILDTSGDNPTIQQIDWVENS